MDIQTLTILKDISWAGVMALIIITIIKPLIEYFIKKYNHTGSSYLQELSDKFDGLEYNLNNLENNHLNDVCRRLENLERGQKELEEKINAIDKKVAILENKIYYK